MTKKLSVSIFLVLIGLSCLVLVVQAQTPCPSACTCMLPSEAAKMKGYSLCGGKQVICGYDKAQNPMYCYQKPATTTQITVITTAPPPCPSACSCLLAADANKMGYTPCGGKQSLCGYDQYQNPKYCYQKPATTAPVVTTTKPTPTPATAAPTTCPSTCSCLFAPDANKMGYSLCEGKQTLCGYDQYQNPQYCYQKPATTAPVVTTTKPTPTPATAVLTPCPSPCSCLPAADAKKLGYALCGGKQTLCGYDQYQNPQYCFQKPATTETIRTTTETPFPTIPPAISLVPTVVTPAPLSPITDLAARDRPVGCLIEGRIYQFPLDPATLKIRIQRVRMEGLENPVDWAVQPGEPGTGREFGEYYQYRGIHDCEGTYLITPVYARSGDSCEWQGTWSPPYRRVTLEGSDLTGMDFTFTPSDIRAPEMILRYDPENPRANQEVEVTIRATDDNDIDRMEAKIDYQTTNGSVQVGTWAPVNFSGSRGNVVGTLHIPADRDIYRAGIYVRVCDSGGNRDEDSLVIDFTSCSDGIRNGGEEGIDCGGPCTECGMVAIQGRILYEKMDETGLVSLGFLPARLTKFRIKEGSDSVTGLKTTRSDGTFTVVIARAGRVGDHLTIRLGDCSNYDAGFNYAVRIAADLDGCHRFVHWTSDEFVIPAEGDVNLGDLRIGFNRDYEFHGFRDNKGVLDTSYCHVDGVACRDYTSAMPGGSIYFSIANAVLTAREYVENLRPHEYDSIGRVTLEYPDGRWSQYQWWVRHIFIREEHGFEDGTIVHEFGHHIETKISQRSSYIGDMRHTNCTEKDPQFAWSEGFSEYLGTIVVYNNQYNPATPQIPFLVGPNINYSIIESPVCPRMNKNVEQAVASVLWDLVDDPATNPFSGIEPFDTINGSEELIIDVLDDFLDYENPTLENFIFWGWDQMAEDPHTIDPLLDHYNITIGWRRFA